MTRNVKAITIFKGKYQCVEGTSTIMNTINVMLTSTNDVQIMGDANLTNYTANDNVLTLPTECRPDRIVKIPVIVNDGTDRVVPFTIDTNGNCTLPYSYTSADVYLSGVNFNVSDRWYA